MPGYLSQRTPRHRHMGMNHTPDVQIVGGGLAGLVAARTVVAAGRTCAIHESAPTPGGRARTDTRHGHRFNRGPHAFYLGGPGAAVLASLGVVPRGVAPRAKGTRMVLDGHAELGPVSVGSLLRTRLFGWRAKRDLGRLLATIDRVDPSVHSTRTASEWIATCTDDERAANVLHALVRLATYVNAPDDLSAEVAITQLQLAVGHGVTYLHGGWQQLVDTLASPAVEVTAGSRVIEIPDAPAVILATGGPESVASLVGGPLPSGPSAEASALDLSLSASAPHGFVLGVDEPIYLSDHGIPSGMTPSQGASVSIAQYLASNDKPDRATMRAFAAHAGIGADQVLDERYLHRMTVVSSIATAETGGFRGRPRAAVPGHAGVFVAGDWVGPRGHLADAVVCSAHDAALAAVLHVDSRSVIR
jgi:2-polyprenyl-6-methoxyphenol hydroxylase-like FAD-dependent oxidoreductase